MYGNEALAHEDLKAQLREELENLQVYQIMKYGYHKKWYYIYKPTLEHYTFCGEQNPQKVEYILDRIFTEG